MCWILVRPSNSNRARSDSLEAGAEVASGNQKTFTNF